MPQHRIHARMACGIHPPPPTPAPPCKNHRDLPAASTRLSTNFSTSPHISNNSSDIYRLQGYITHLLTLLSGPPGISSPASANRRNPLSSLAGPILLSGLLTGSAYACQHPVSPAGKTVELRHENSEQGFWKRRAGYFPASSFDSGKRSPFMRFMPS